jgi:hypothetical protein
MAVAVGRCSFDIEFGGDDDTISKERVAEKARTQLDKKFASQGLPALPPVTCDEDLERKVGETTDCEAKGDFGKQSGTAKVTAVDGSDTELEFTTAKRGIVPE